VGKYHHMCKLAGAENYSQWRRQMVLALEGERLWGHCSNSGDPLNLAELASTIPLPTDSSKIMTKESKKILEWYAKDAQAKSVIDHKILTIIASQLDESQTAHEQWDFLAQQYLCTNILSQYELCTHVRSGKLKDADDDIRYLGVFEDAHHKFITMGVTHSNDGVVFDLLHGLPETVDWQIFR
ncbi:hypothetical protein PAXRUDRAFT_103222, partial [Paxillus rubicundulus Ve08.2h10]